MRRLQKKNVAQSYIYTYQYLQRRYPRDFLKFYDKPFRYLCPECHSSSALVLAEVDLNSNFKNSPIWHLASKRGQPTVLI